MRSGRDGEAKRRVLSLLHDRAARTRISDIHAYVLRHHLYSSDLIAAQLVSTCAAIRRPSYALRLFRYCSAPSVSLFGAAIKALSLSSPSAPDAFSLFSLLRSRSLSPDRLVLAPLLKAAAHFADVGVARSLHGLTICYGFVSHPPVTVGILELYNACGQMFDAKQLFDEMPRREVIAWNLMINGFCRRGDAESALGLFRRMNERSVVTWNSMIAGLARCGVDVDALQLFREMWDFSGFDPDDATLAAVLPVCARLGELELGSLIHRYAERKDLLKETVHVANSIIDMYCKCGDLASARAVFDQMANKSVVSWNAMIAGMAFNGCAEIGLHLFDEMLMKGEKPNAGTFVGALFCCIHAGWVDRGRELFRSMIDKHGIRPGLEHYGCMVDLLGRCGQVEEAYELIGSMPMRPNAAILGALLSACRHYKELRIAEVAAKELIELEPSNSGNYVLLGNLYAEAGRWEEAENMRWLMKEKSVQKAPGQSLVDRHELSYRELDKMLVQFVGKDAESNNYSPDTDMVNIQTFIEIK